MRIPIAVQSYTHRSLPVSAQRIVNWFPEVQPADAKARSVLLPTPGVETWADLPGGGVVRGVHVALDSLFVVCGSRIYRVRQDQSVTDCGAVPGASPVVMADNGAQVITVTPSNGNGYVTTIATDSTAQITDVDYSPSVGVEVLDGYAVFVKRDSFEFFISAINDATVFNGDEASAEANPDNLVAIKRIGREIWLFGERTTEIWQNVGDPDFPLARASGGVLERGCIARHSVAGGSGLLFWLGDDKVVYAGQNLSPVRISTHAIEQAIAGLTVVSDARGWFYEQEGHQFYVLTFPTEGETFVFDAVTRSWHERASLGYSGWRCIAGVNYGGGVFAGDALQARLWRVDTRLYSEAGQSITRIATGTPLHAEGQRLFVTMFEADLEQGAQIGVTTDPPRIWLQHSDDGGRTWSNQREASLGRQGEYKTRVEWRRCGTARDRVFRLTMSDPVRTALIAANIDVEPGAS
jgi:hypothetical protein